MLTPQTSLVAFFLTLALIGQGNPRKMQAVLTGCFLLLVFAVLKVQRSIYLFFLHKVFGGPSNVN